MTEITSEEQILIDAVQKTAADYQAEPSVPNLRAWNAAKGSLEKFQREKADASSGPRLKNIAEVARFLIRAGYKVQERTVRNHRKQGLFPIQPGGEFLQKDIEAYANNNLDRPGHEEDGNENKGSKDRLTSAMADERELRVKKLSGQLIDAAEEEARDARIWRSVRNEIEQEAPGVINELVEEVLALGLPDEHRQRIVSLVPQLRESYQEKVADIFDRYAVEGGVWVTE